jgi:hypothetical protein
MNKDVKIAINFLVVNFIAHFAEPYAILHKCSSVFSRQASQVNAAITEIAQLGLCQSILWLKISIGNLVPAGLAEDVLKVFRHESLLRDLNHEEPLRDLRNIFLALRA